MKPGFSSTLCAPPSGSIGGQDVGGQLQINNGNVVLRGSRAIQPRIRFLRADEKTLYTPGARVIGIRWDKIIPPPIHVHSFDIDCHIVPKNIGVQGLSVLYLWKWYLALLAVHDRRKFAEASLNPWHIVHIAERVQQILTYIGVPANAIGAPWAIC